MPQLERVQIPEPFVGSIDLPAPTIEERFEADMVRPLPLSTRESVVLVLPDESVTFNGKPEDAPHYTIPSAPEPATRDFLNRAVRADARSVERLQGRLVAELVDAENGEGCGWAKSAAQSMPAVMPTAA